jgi:hypothetical protein
MVFSSFAVEFTLTGLIVYITQLYFAARVYFFLNVSTGKIIGGVVVLVSTVALIFGIVSAAFQFQHPSGAELASTRMKVTIGLWHGLSMVADIITTFVMVFSLKTRHTDIRRTNSTVLHLIYYSITRGIFVTTLQLSLVVLFSFDTDRLFWMAPHLCCNKFYVITMIAMLNSRTKLLQMHHRSGIINSSQFTPGHNRADMPGGDEGQDQHMDTDGERYELNGVNAKELTHQTPLEIKVDIQVSSGMDIGQDVDVDLERSDSKMK